MLMMNKKFHFLWLLLSFSLSALAQESFTERSGDVLQIVMPIGAGVVSVLDKSEDQPWLQFGLTFGSTWLTTHALKRAINKERPNGGDFSLPSGHSAAAFSSAAFVQKRYGWKYGLPGYVLASYVGWTRIDANKHDVWDVLAGAFVGTVAAQIFTKTFPVGNSELNLELCHSSLKLRIQF